MKLRRVLAVILALAIAGGIYVLFGTREDNSRGAVTLWYEKDSPLAQELETLVKSYNSDIKRETLPVALKRFDSEAELAEAYETGSPDLLLCSHLRAFSLYRRSKLTDISTEETFTSPAYPKSITSRNGSVGSSFFPFGISVPVVAVSNSLAQQVAFDSLESFFTAASDYTAATGKPFFSVSSTAEQFYIYLLRFGVEFGGNFDMINSDKQYLSIYNAFAEAAFDGSIAFLGNDAAEYFADGAIPCVITCSAMLKTIAANSISVRDIPAPEGSLNHDTLGEAYGLAVTNGGCRSTRDTAAFITWLFENGRAAQAASDARLAPASESASVRTDAIGEALAEIVESALVSLPEADSDYMLNKADFDESFLEKAETLLP